MALSAEKFLVEQDGELIEMPAAAEKLYQGALIKVNAAGYAAKCAIEAGSTFAGIAYETVDNSGGSAGDKKVRIKNSGAYEMALSASQADVGSKVYATADDTITLTEGTDKKPIVGVIVKYISASKVLVKLTPFQGTGA